VTSVLRSRRFPAPSFVALCRSVSRLGKSIRTGTPASEFVASGVLRPASVQRKHECLLRTVAFEYRQSPRSTLSRVFVEIRRTARRTVSRRIFERFADQGQGRVSGLGADLVRLSRTQLRTASYPRASLTAARPRVRKSECVGQSFCVQE